jgi:hypothetical protein
VLAATAGSSGQLAIEAGPATFDQAADAAVLGITPSGLTPPDTIVAAGPSAVFEMMNMTGVVLSKTGQRLKTVALPQCRRP